MSTADAPVDAPRKRTRVRQALSGSRALLPLVYRDPDHLSERLTLYAADTLGPPSREWAERARAERPDVPEAVIAEELRQRSARIARIDGAVAGTPFLIALVPGYVSYLGQEARMVLRIAALHGRDPTSLRTAAEVLALRGARPGVDAAEEALLHVRANPMPDKPSERRPLRTWFDSVYRLLVFGGFLDAPGGTGKPPRSRTRTVLMSLVAFAVWVTTWVLPVTFMIAMSWACESRARDLGRRAMALYGGGAPNVEAAIAQAAAQDRPGRDSRNVLRTVALTLSVAIPIVFVAYVNHVRNTVGINWLGAIGALVAVSIVGAVSVLAARR
jgi:hypothetical protein